MPGIVPTYDEVEPLALPPRSYDEVVDDSDVPRTPDLWWREGLWTVTYRDDGSMGVRDCPTPGVN